LSTDLLAKYAELNKIDATAYEKHFANAMVDLWSMSDRAVRTCLLVSLRYLVALTPDTLVSKNIFDPMLAGFADSNPKMREETLKNLVYVLDKIDETQIRDKLLRSINSLQGDQEASLRTNATIFLGKLSSRVAEEVRHRAIYPGFARAMKDPFVHCRIAGLKSTLSCLSIIEKPLFATKMLPQVCALTVDGNSTVRELAIKVMEESLLGLKDLNSEMKSQQAAKEAERERLGVAEKERISASNMGSMGNSAAGGSQSQASTMSSTMSSQSSSGSMGSYGSAGQMGGGGNSNAGYGQFDHGNGNGRQNSYDRGSGDRDLLDFGNNNGGGSAGGGVRGMSLPPAAPIGNDADGWGDDDDWGLDDSPPSKPSSQPNDSMGSIGGLSLNKSNPPVSRPSSHMDDPFADLGRPEAPAVVRASPSKSKPARARGQKLKVEKGGDDGWDDF
jgi:SCY1-like protein 1